jgi:activator of 2-hydroxyglutaryl-CoA dehydratase
LEDALGREAKIPEDPQMVGAYGDGMIARESTIMRKMTSQSRTYEGIV